MFLFFRLIGKIVAWADFVAFTALMYLLSWLPWPGTHPAARIFNAWCRSFVRALDVDLRLHQKNRAHLPERFILIANHPAAFEDIGIPALFDVVSLAKIQDAVVTNGIDHLVHEPLGRDIGQLEVAIVLQHVVPHRVHQVCFSETHSPVNEQRVV